MEERVSDIEEGIKKYLPKEEGFQKTILKAMNYSVLAGGKRLRPMFIYETYRMFGGKDESVVRPFMAAMEMIHTYSLVHDDLPAMDNDDYRRGRLTTHKVFGEDMGILAGDALLNYAFETMLLAFDSDTDVKIVAKAAKVMAVKAGVYGMVGGQVADVENTGKPLTKELIQFIYEKKTAALLEGSMMIGAVLSGASEEEVNAIESIASAVGMAFQIQDDILDIEGDEKVIGKPVHSDEKNDKYTYATIHGIEAARKAVERYSMEAIDGLRALKGDSAFLEELVSSLIHREK
jgi:geranylgeranyl diphosphate synthase type II